MSLISCKNCGKQISDLATRCPHCGTDFSEEEKAYSTKLFKTICDALTEAEINFNVNEEEGNVMLRGMRLEANIKKATFMAIARKEDIIIFGTYEDFSIPTENLSAVNELLHRINYDHIFPYLNIDYDYKNVACRFAFAFKESTITNGDFMDALICVNDHLQKYANAILATSLGFQTPEEALASCQ